MLYRNIFSYYSKNALLDKICRILLYSGYLNSYFSLEVIVRPFFLIVCNWDSIPFSSS